MAAPTKFENALIVLGMIFALAVVPTIWYFRWPIILGVGAFTIILTRVL